MSALTALNKVLMTIPAKKLDVKQFSNPVLIKPFRKNKFENKKIRFRTFNPIDFTMYNTKKKLLELNRLY